MKTLQQFLESSNPRIPRKKGQPAKSKKHSDLYTDEDPKGTIHGLGFPESPQQFIDKTTDSDGIRDLEEQFCDGGLHILNSNFRDVAIVKFQNLFPVSLTSLNFDATETDINYFTANASFRYTVYNITDTSGNLL